MGDTKSPSAPGGSWEATTIEIRVLSAAAASAGLWSRLDGIRGLRRESAVRLHLPPVRSPGVSGISSASLDLSYGWACHATACCPVFFLFALGLLPCCGGWGSDLGFLAVDFSDKSHQRDLCSRCWWFLGVRIHLFCYLVLCISWGVEICIRYGSSRFVCAAASSEIRRCLVGWYTAFISFPCSVPYTRGYMSAYVEDVPFSVLDRGCSPFLRFKQNALNFQRVACN